MSTKDTEILYCEYCKKIIEAKKITPGKTRFCCRQCLYDWMKIFNRHERKIFNCKNCGKKIFALKDRDRRFCSMKCVYEFTKGRKLSSQHKEIISITRRRDWANGVYKNAVVGKTKWIEHVKRDGTHIKCQGSWELAYAEYLDLNQIDYNAHIGALWYDAADGKKRVYLPDFYLIDTNLYIDIKNDYLLKVDSDKLERVKKCNPNINLKIITKKDLMKLKLIDQWGKKL